ncbi:MAG: hypothetical protein ACTSW1_02910 [Candidatus Hodarchaeales archaeon]
MDQYKKLRTGVLLIWIIILSGCLISKGPLEKTIIRKAENKQGERVIEFIENYDFLDFAPIEANDSRVYCEFTQTGFTKDKFVRNFSLFLVKAEESYLESRRIRVQIGFYISCFNLTQANVSNIDSIALSERNQSSFASNQFVGGRGIGAIIPKNESIVQMIESGYNETSSLTQFTEKIMLPESFWFLYVGISYYWSSQGIFGSCGEYEFSELIFVNTNLEVLGFLARSGGSIC